MTHIARWCFRHRWLVVAAWLLAIVATTAIKTGVGTHYASDFGLHSTESYRAERLLHHSAPNAAGDTEQVVVAVERGRVTDPAVRARFEALLRRIQRVPHVTRIVSPYAGARGAQQIAPSGRVAFASVTFDVGASALSSHATAAWDQLITSASGHGIRFEAEGQVAKDGNPSNDTSSLEIGFLAAGVVLFLVFGSFAAMLLPLLTAGVSLGTGIAVVGLLSNAIPMADFSSQLAMLIGLGVGVDYALFVVTRYKQAQLRGVGREEAVVQALDTSGRAVLFAGIIVCIAMVGMLLLGVSFLYGVALAAAITVAFTVLAALTLLPALLSLLGGSVLRRSERRAIREHRLRASDQSPLWARWTAVLGRRPALFATVATLLMVVLSLPFLSMRLGSTDAGSDPAGTTTYRAYHLLAKGFGPGYNGPLELVARVGTPAQRAAFTAAVRAAAGTPGVASVASPAFLAGEARSPSADAVGVASVYPTGSPQAASTSALLTRLRTTVLPRATRGSGLHVLVGGQTAIFADFSAVLTAKLPLFVGIVVFVSFLLLLAVFRSVFVPLTAAFMNLLSTGAALGVVTAVFQFGWLGSLIGITAPGPIAAFLPVLMFPILFGLSMDYEVFLVARIYEEWHRTGDNRQAVSHGLAATGKTISAAAAIMVLVFAAFVLGGERIIELFGIGLASAVLLDAIIARAVLVPAIMLLLGETNWRLPTVLERIVPHLRVEGARTVPAARAAAVDV